MRKAKVKWQPETAIHEDLMPMLIASTQDMADIRLLMSIDDWNEMEDDERAYFDLCHSLQPLTTVGYCKYLDSQAGGPR